MILPFLELVQGIQVQHYNMMSMQSKIPKSTMPGSFSPGIPLLFIKSALLEEKKSMYPFLEVKTRVGQPAGVITYQKNVQKFEKGIP
jgi:hypothetical protein